jgi:hypothetical protein
MLRLKLVEKGVKVDNRGPVLDTDIGPTGAGYSASIDRDLVFKGPVAWTGKKTETEPSPTDCNRTIGRGCLGLGSVGLPVASISKYLKTVQKPVAIGCNRSSCSM